MKPLPRHLQDEFDLLAQPETAWVFLAVLTPIPRPHSEDGVIPYARVEKLLYDLFQEGWVVPIPMQIFTEHVTVERADRILPNPKLPLSPPIRIDSLQEGVASTGTPTGKMRVQLRNGIWCRGDGSPLPPKRAVYTDWRCLFKVYLGNEQ